MACEQLTNMQTFGDLLVYPTGCNYYFYLIILLFLIGIISWFLFKAERKDNSRADYISNVAVSSIVITILAFLGTFVKNSSDIPMIQSDILLILLSFTIVTVLVWIFKD